MATLFTVLPFTVNDPTLPRLDLSKVRTVGGPSRTPDDTATEHWAFGAFAPYVGLRETITLVEQSVAPQQFPTHLRMSTDEGTGLSTGITEAAEIADTWAIVCRANGTGVKNAFGTYTFGYGGAGLFTRSDMTAWRYNIEDMTPVNDDPGEVTEGQWQWIGVSRDLSGSGGGTRIVNVDGAAETQAMSGTFTPRPNGKDIVIGNGYGDISTGGTLDVAEVMYWDSALDTTALAAAYARSQARMAALGITI